MDDVSTTRPKLTTCLVCGGNYKASHFAALLKCEECGFISADMELSDAEVIKLYSRYYFEGAEYGNYHDDEDALKLNFEKRASELHAHIPNLSGCDLFEIGCAYGFF